MVIALWIFAVIGMLFTAYWVGRAVLLLVVIGLFNSMMHPRDKKRWYQRRLHWH